MPFAHPIEHRPAYWLINEKIVLMAINENLRQRGLAVLRGDQYEENLRKIEAIEQEIAKRDERKISGH